MDKHPDREKSRRREREIRDSDRDLTKDHKDRDRDRDRGRDHRDRDRHHKHRTREAASRECDEDRHHNDKRHRSSREDKHRHRSDHVSKHDRPQERFEREGSRGRTHELDSKRGRSHEPEDARDGFEDRVLDVVSKLERSPESMNEQEGNMDGFLRAESLERRHLSRFHKRKGREESKDMIDSSEKRIKFYDAVKQEGDVWKERKEKKPLNDRVVDEKELDGRGRGERRGKPKFEDGVKIDDVNASLKEVRRERRKFGDRVIKELDSVDSIESAQMGLDVKKEEPDEQTDYALAKSGPSSGGFTENGGALEPLIFPSTDVPETTLSYSHPLPIKVSSIYTTNENKGVSITGSHEVPGKSSTDGPSSAAGKNGNLSLDALAKAKKALQMQKELSEKLKKIPVFKGSGLNRESDSSQQVGTKTPSSGGALHLHVSSVTSTVSMPVGSMPTVSTPPVVAMGTPQSSMASFPGLANMHNVEAVKRAQELAAKMGFHQDPQFAPLINMFPGQVAASTAAALQKPAKAPVLRLDALGREIDEYGSVVNMPKLNTLSTLKVNINKQKKDAFQILRPELDVDPESNPHYDERMGVDKKKLLRPKRMNFQFVEEGKWSKEAEMIKLKSQFGEAQAKELKAKQAQLAKAKAEPDINPNLIEVSERIIMKEKPKEPIPDIEWWDAPFLHSGHYNHTTEGDVMEHLKTDKITIYIEHPRPIEPPAELPLPPPQPLKLTKKEQKKLRTQRRLAREKDRQEMIRQGLLEPPKPKVKMSNLMKVLGSEATQDPTRLEMEIRSAAAERERAHADRNVARKLTPAERREKKERKLFDDRIVPETVVSVYKVNDLSHPQTRFKVDVNAQENRLTGCAVISDAVTVVVVEGGSKSIKRYGKLMLKRINWAAAVKSDGEDGGEEERQDNKCVLVWQGSAARPSFSRFLVHECRTEAAARKVFADAGIVHYWDIAMNFSED